QIALAALFIFAASAWAGDKSVTLMNFAGGDGSYAHAMKDGITFGLSNDPPYGYIDEKTKEPDGIDIRMFKALTQRLGMKNVKWEVVPFDALLPGLLAKRWDAVVLHETAARLKVVGFSSPGYWYGSALAVAKGNPKNI